MAAYSFVGTWEIETCWIQGNYGVDSELEGTKFVLDDTGDVTWCPESEETSNVPLFSCETYEIYSTNIHGAIVRFGAYGEHIIEFKAEPSQPVDNLVLSCEGWCVLHCVRVTNDEPDCNPIEGFSLLPAVEDGFFSDMVIEAQDNKQFHVHSSILGLLGTDMSWMKDPPPFSGLPEGVVGSILHWLYAECLPNAMTEDLAVQVIDAVKEYPCMLKLVEDCKVYLKNMALKQQIVELVSDMHTCANQIIEYFNTPGECLGCHPAKLCLVVKQSVRETAVAVVKLLLLCELFSKRKNELSREERHEVIRYARSRLPIFMCQLRKLLESLKITFSSMTPAQRQEVATYLVPEIEAILDTISALIFEVKTALELIMQALTPAEGTDRCDPLIHGKATRDALGKSLRNVLRIRELAKLKNFHQKVTFSLMHLLHKKESFAEMSDTNRVRSVSRNLEQLVEELPVFLLRLEEVTTAMDDRLQWREFKFCFKVATSKVSGILSKLILHRETLQDVIIRFCSLVQREAFTMGLFELGILHSTAQVMGTSAMGAAHHSDQYKDSTQQKREHPAQHGFKLSLVESLMKPPPVNQSCLSKAAAKLLKSERFADMVFEIPMPQPAPSAPNSKSKHNFDSNPASFLTKDIGAANEACSSDSAHNTPSRMENIHIEDSGSIVMKAHRVVVAARCDWFRRALQSGMKEAIHRRIVIHDTTPGLFRKLLTYLYTGKLDMRVANAEHLTELVLLGDRYELDSLKNACEKTLAMKYLDKDSVFYYLNLADQYNASYLRESCVKFIATRADMLKGDHFAELPPSLQQEVYAAVSMWPLDMGVSGRRRRHYSHVGAGADHLSMEALLDRASLEDEGSISECSSVEEIEIDRGRLNDCLARLRDVLGPRVSLDDLNRIALAADCDANRAVNFYYSSSLSPPNDS